MPLGKGISANEGAKQGHPP